jgi:hypothetical protein
MKEKVTVYKLIDMDAESIFDSTVLVGTLNDVRIWAKNLWKIDQDWVESNLTDWVENELIEEGFYALMDDNRILVDFVTNMGYDVIEVCEVPLDDFYDGRKPTQELIDEVLFQIKVDIAEGDLTALDEMLKAMPVQQLVSYLPEK